MTQDELSGRTRDVLHKIAELENAGEMVTVQRIARELELPRQNIWSYIGRLRERGLIVYQPTERFTAPVRLSEAGWRVSEVSRAVEKDLQFPILGEIAAGQPTYTDDRIEGYATRLQDVLDLHEEDFLLRVRGDSMVGIGIYPGDLVAIHPTDHEPLTGEIVLVAVPGEDTATLKRWHRNNGTVTLHSENPAYAPMTYPADQVLIQGALVGHIGTGRARRTLPEA